MDKLDPRRAADPIAAVEGTDGRSRLILPRGAGDGNAAEARDQDHGLAGLASRRGVLTLGLAVGLGGVGALDAVAAKKRRFSQGGWQFCSKCRGLWYAPSATGSVCPAGGEHNPSSVTYTLFYGSRRPRSAQPDWRYCDKCAGLWYAGSRTTSICPAGGAHNRDPRGNYHLFVDTTRDGGRYDKDWRYCHRCKGLWYSSSGVREGACPAFGPHRLEGSGNYSLMRTPPA